jgi:hypothetical protein
VRGWVVEQRPPGRAPSEFDSHALRPISPLCLFERRRIRPVSDSEPPNGTRRVTMPQVLTRRREPISLQVLARGHLYLQIQKLTGRLALPAYQVAITQEAEAHSRRRQLPPAIIPVVNGPDRLKLEFASASPATSAAPRRVSTSYFDSDRSGQDTGTYLQPPLASWQPEPERTVATSRIRLLSSAISAHHDRGPRPRASCQCQWAQPIKGRSMGANRPPFRGVACRLGCSIIKAASSKKSRGDLGLAGFA